MPRGDPRLVADPVAGPHDGARRLLGMFGAVMAPGFLAERYVRASLRPGGTLLAQLTGSNAAFALGGRLLGTFARRRTTSSSSLSGTSVR